MTQDGPDWVGSHGITVALVGFVNSGFCGVGHFLVTIANLCTYRQVVAAYMIVPGAWCKVP